MKCSSCGATVPDLPVEPLYTITDAAMLVGWIKVSTFKRAMQRHKAQLDPAQYTGSWGRRRRLLSAADVRYLRSVMVSHHFHDPNHVPRRSGASDRAPSSG